MQILDNLIILTLIILSFISGLKLAGHYYEKCISEYQYALKIMTADKGLGYIAPPQKKKVVPIGQPFMDRLKENGHATQALRTTSN